MTTYTRRVKRKVLTVNYTFAHWLRDRMPWLWAGVERANAGLFRIRYGRRLLRVEQDAEDMAAPYEMVPISKIPTDELVAFFHSQPEDIYRWFTPHDFDAETMARLQRNASFLAYVMKREGKIVAYFFLRCYFNGECYFGRLVDAPHMRQGIGTLINQVSFHMSEALHLESYQTIANGNIASIKSCARAYRLQPIRVIANGDMLYKNCKL